MAVRRPISVGAVVRNIADNIVLSVRDNSSAFGYSITITGSYGMLEKLEGAPAVSEIFAALVAAALAFSCLELLVLALVREVRKPESQSRVLISRMMNFVSVGGGVAMAALCGRELDGLAAWSLGAFLATIVFVCLEAVALEIARHVE
ncbi:hypothetical protein [Stakelama saccharophila]|uniref:Uncharacterized protein n=1 Tax=Stakelama saccharophila TaxID=3075605 RepID=A0ABZ0B703_9SPHN|nr:hypothetical protein [Stakelama sp. W311]WNO52406.1 hypothetical protein RPR59_07905 [Stakelama sp. W311]